MADSKNTGNEDKKSVGLWEALAGGATGIMTFFAGLMFATRPVVKRSLEKGNIIDTRGNRMPVSEASGMTFDVVTRRPAFAIDLAFSNSKVAMGAVVTVSALAAVGAGWLVNKLRNRKSHVEQYEENKQSGQPAERGRS